MISIRSQQIYDGRSPRLGARLSRRARRGALTPVALALAAAIGLVAGARAEPGRSDTPPAEARVLRYSGALPGCDDASVLAEITSAFSAREMEYWSSGLAISTFEKVRETGYRTNGPSYIPRRYCDAEALFNDGARRRVVYNLGEALGFIGLGEGVTWCVVGVDRNHAFSPNCRAAGP